MESNLAQMKDLRDTNNSIAGGITELRLALQALTPEKKKKSEKKKAK